MDEVPVPRKGDQTIPVHNELSLRESDRRSMIRANGMHPLLRKWLSVVLVAVLCAVPIEGVFKIAAAESTGGYGVEVPGALGTAVTASVYDVQLNGPASVPAGEAAQTALKVNGQPVPGATAGIAYASSNEQVAKVTADGLVEGRSAGETVISATYGGGKGQFVLTVTPSQAVPVQDRLLAKSASSRTLELEERGVVQLTDFYTVEQQLGDRTVLKSLSDVMVGARNVKLAFNSAGKVFRIVIEGETPVDVMRVGIRRSIADISDLKQLDHPQIDLKSAGGLRVTDKKAGTALAVPAGTTATFKTANGQIILTQGGSEVYRTANRLYVESAQPGELMQAMSFTRAYGNPKYRGMFEISLASSQTALKLINEVNMEQYLYQVVPSEMPASFGLEALRAQAIAARTYALTDYVSNRFADRGFHIDDSTLSQVYNNSAEHVLTTQAVNDTSGMIMLSNGELVDARFYSTSGGYGASKHEVWSDTGTNQFPGTPIPYLVAQSYTYDPADPTRMLQINTQDEQQVNAFYKNLSLTGYDSESYYFRWKVALSRTELENTVNANLAGRQAADPLFVLTKQPDGSYASKPIPAGGIGTLKNMYAAKRGAGGNMTELVIEGTTGTYKIIKEYNIRFTIRPSKTYTLGADVILHRAKGGSTGYDASMQVKNPTILTSAFAAFDLEKDANGQPVRVTFYGGGNGHGVGMSQYGASMLGSKGWSYDRILNSYYANMNIVKLNGTVLTLTGLRLEGLPGALNAGETRKLTVVGTYSDGSEAQLTAGVAFSSSRESVAAVAADGTVKALAGGSAKLTAKYGGQQAEATLNVAGPAALERLELGAPAELWAGDTAQLSVTAVYSDDSTTLLREGVSFASSDPGVAAVTAEGVLTAAAPGEATVTASYGGKQAAAAVKVVPVPALERIAITGKKYMAEGETDQLVVTGYYAGGAERVLTKGVTFESKHEKMAVVTDTGTVKALKNGSTFISVTAGGLTETYHLVISNRK